MEEYSVQEKLGKIKDTPNGQVEVNVVKWGDKSGMIDIREWKEDFSPGSGIVLTNEEAFTLTDLLNKYFEDKGGYSNA